MSWILAHTAILAIGALPAAPIAATRTTTYIAKGDELDAVVRVLLANNAEDISSYVSFGMADHRLDWFILEDGTCLNITSVHASGKYVVRYMNLGEAGKGYPGKLDWGVSVKVTRVDRLELR